MDDRLSYEEKKELPDSVFGLTNAVNIRCLMLRMCVLPRPISAIALRTSSLSLPEPYSPAPRNTGWMLKALRCSHMPRAESHRKCGWFD